MRTRRSGIVVGAACWLLGLLSGGGCTTSDSIPGKPCTIPELGMELMPIPANTFTMGSPDSEEGRDDHETQHPVKISRSLAMDFCAALDRRERAAERIPQGYEYRLPTEAEWENACRAGTTTRFSGGNDQRDLAASGWYAENSGAQAYPDAEGAADWAHGDKSIRLDKITNRGLMIHAVGDKRPNAWGLHDMHGNVFEWCLDWLDESTPSDKVIDPLGPATGFLRIVRGGSGYDQSRHCRSAFCGGSPPPLRSSHIGFRVVLAPARPKE